MRLTRIEIKNFRSIFTKGDHEPVELDLSENGNYIVGKNNVGKSNIIKAIKLALDRSDNPVYQPDFDQPRQMDWARPRIRLDFEMQRKRGKYETLLKYAKEYEESIVGEGNPTFADEDIIKYQVKFYKTKDSRQEEIRAKGSGAISGNRDLREKALKQFHECIQLVDIESGEDLESLLQRGFNALFTRALTREFSSELDEAENLRDKYLGHVRKNIMYELNKELKEKMNTHSSEVDEVKFVPNIEDMEASLSDVNIAIDDAVETPLSEKGTGIRSLLIQMMMSFIADSSRRSLIFAIEEPEAFLHPEKHHDLANSLESFTSKSDISLLMTTHSPFMLTEHTDGQVFTAYKDSEGRTKVQSERVRPLAVNRAKDLLTGSSEVPDTTGVVDEVPASADCIVVTEGWTDMMYIKSAADKLNKEKTLEDVHISHFEGANDAAKNAVVLKEIYEEKQIISLFDDDGPGGSAYDLLTDKLKFQGNEEAVKYSKWVSRNGCDVDSEDLFSESIIDKFHDEYGESSISGYMERSNGERHIQIKKEYKREFVNFIQKEADSEDYEKWKSVLEFIEYTK